MMMTAADTGNCPFEVKDCALVTRMAGVDPALNLRELRERLGVCPTESLFHHFCETAIRPTFDDPEFRNDFAVWAARDLQDRILAERLGIINPYDYPNIEDLRRLVIEIIDERLAEIPYIPGVTLGRDFHFMQAVTVVFDTGRRLRGPEELPVAIKDLSLSSIFYHYVEARRRTPRGTDDFTAWLAGCGDGYEALAACLQIPDFYFLGLSELKDCLLKAVAGWKAGQGHA